jgi:hypothetical protein
MEPSGPVQAVMGCFTFTFTFMLTSPVVKVRAWTVAKDSLLIGQLNLFRGVEYVEFFLHPSINPSWEIISQKFNLSSPSLCLSSFLFPSILLVLFLPSRALCSPYKPSIYSPYKFHSEIVFWPSLRCVHLYSLVTGLTAGYKSVLNSERCPSRDSFSA